MHVHLPKLCLSTTPISFLTQTRRLSRFDFITLPTLNPLKQFAPCCNNSTKLKLIFQLQKLG